MYKKINVDDEELLFTHQHQEVFQKPNAQLLDTMLKAEQYIATTYQHHRHAGVHALLLSTQQHLLQVSTLLSGHFNFKDLTSSLLVRHLIQANATRLILVYCNPTGKTVVRDHQLLGANLLKHELLEYSLWLDDFFIISRPEPGDHHMQTTSLARLGVV